MNDHTQSRNRRYEHASNFETKMRVSSLADRVPIKAIAGLLVLALWMTLSYANGKLFWNEMLTASAIIGGLLIMRVMGGTER